jgi:hypothetical protein
MRKQPLFRLLEPLGAILAGQLSRPMRTGSGP